MYSYGMQTAGIPTVVAGGTNDGWGGTNGILGLLALLGVFRGGYGLNGGGGNGCGCINDGVQTGQLAGLQSQVSAMQATMNSNEIENDINNLATQSNNQYIGIQNSADNNARLLSQQLAAISTALAGGNFTTLQSINGLGANVTASLNQNQLSTLNSFNQQNVSFLQGINTLASQQMNGTNQIINGINQLAAVNAQCCCDLKQAIHTDGEETRALINALNVQNLQGQLNDAKNTISDLNQTNVLIQNNAQQTATILQHLRPFPCPPVVS